MPEQHAGDDAHSRRERWIVAGAVVLLVLLRSIVFVFWEQSYFDSDQAIIGLMGKHLIEGRAFPLFYYGQHYMLGVEAYLAAPFFAVAGISVTTLKLPLLLLNLAVALLLLRVLEREAGLRPRLALVPVLFFAVPAAAVAAEILAPNGGNFAPFVYAVLIWVTRMRPAWCGFFFGLGFLQREFTLYAGVALLFVETIQGELFTREGIRRRLTTFRTAAEVWLVVQFLKQYSSAAGPGSSIANLMTASNNVVELASRICTDVSTVPRGVAALITTHYPLLFGTQPMNLSEFGIETTVAQGFPGSWVLLLAAMLLPIGTIAYRLVTERRWRPEYAFPLFLITIGLLSAAGYVIARCGVLHHHILRYELLSVLGAIGLGAWFLQAAQSRALRATWIGIVCLLTVVTAAPHVRMVTEYVRNPPTSYKQLIGRHLAARGIKYAYSDYWRSYVATFLTNEQIIVAATDFSRVLEYNHIVDQHRSEAIRLSIDFCDDGRTLIPGLFICKP
jgi:hypothetical protein